MGGQVNCLASSQTVPPWSGYPRTLKQREGQRLGDMASPDSQLHRRDNEARAEATGGGMRNRGTEAQEAHEGLSLADKGSCCRAKAKAVPAPHPTSLWRKMKVEHIPNLSCS